VFVCVCVCLCLGEREFACVDVCVGGVWMFESLCVCTYVCASVSDFDFV